ncbi:hypothetical protein ACIQFZ_41795, partial [Streptomyces sp. NPDC093064]|uniref:hypothetical protein n=1 Tax=Streptomyces sp. NPDC093064 TaxID=3366020 RepID=UPI00380FE0D8
MINPTALWDLSVRVLQRCCDLHFARCLMLCSDRSARIHRLDSGLIVSGLPLAVAEMIWPFGQGV